MKISIVVFLAFSAIVYLYARILRWRAELKGMSSNVIKRLVWTFVLGSILLLSSLFGLSWLYRSGVLGTGIVYPLVGCLILAYLIAVRRLVRALR